MHPRAAELLHALDLTPHPEGGFFREIHRSAFAVDPRDGRTPRAALTTIYFLLTAGQVSRWHRVLSDEVWHFLEGEPLKLIEADPELETISERVLWPHAGDAEPVRVVAAGRWQAARTTGAYTLMGCTVGPGFEFADFGLLRDLPLEAEVIRRRHPHVMEFL